MFPALQDEVNNFTATGGDIWLLLTGDINLIILGGKISQLGVMEISGVTLTHRCIKIGNQYDELFRKKKVWELDSKSQE